MHTLAGTIYCGSGEHRSRLHAIAEPTEKASHASVQNRGTCRSTAADWAFCCRLLRLLFACYAF